jgi:hypothetical protein
VSLLVLFMIANGYLGLKGLALNYLG